MKEVVQAIAFVLYSVSLVGVTICCVLAYKSETEREQDKKLNWLWLLLPILFISGAICLSLFA